MTAVLDLSPGPVVQPRLNTAAAEVARLVNAARAALLGSGTAVTVEQIAEARGTSTDAVRQWMSRRRKAGDLATVTHEGVALVPTFQLDDAFDARPEAAAIVSRLIEYGMSGWAVWDWAEVPSGWLDGETPADLIRAGRVGEVDVAVDGLVANA
ncbi:hypothetical protein BH24ACT15_BH24ACT15_09800 [soil metagenome]